MPMFEIHAARAKTGKRAHVRKNRDGSPLAIAATSEPKALKGYGCNVIGKRRSVVTSNGWKLTAKRIAA